MNYFSAFLRLLLWRPHRALGSLYWYATGRRVRARNRLRLVAAQAPHAYQIWIRAVERQADAVAGAKATMADWRDHPRLTVFLPILHDEELQPAIATLKSLSRQCMGDWQAVAVTGQELSTLPALKDPRIRVSPTSARNAAEALNIALAEASADYIVPLDPGVQLSATALFHYAEAALNGAGANILFGDHDECDRRHRRSRPWFKPQWNEEMFLAQDYISPACAISVDAAHKAGPVEEDLAEAALFTLLLRTAAGGKPIVHIPHIQCHLPGPVADNQAARVRAVARHLRGDRATVSPGPFRSVKVQWPLPDPLPLVSIIVPTRDKMKLLKACLTGVLSATRYQNIELLVLDNGSSEPETLRYLNAVGRHPKVRVICYDRPYNYSAINNYAVSHARGDYLCLLNNDTDVLDENWLTELMRYAVRPHVGAVGAKLLYDDGTIQHAGVVVGLGEAAGHAHRFLKPDDPGYFCQAHVPQYISAVTAACLVVEKAKFVAVGGLDEEGLQIAFNDVDLCLKLEKAGWRNVYAPQAVMVHHESKSRGKDHSPEHIDRYRNELGLLQQRWGTKTRADPLHHRNLDRSSETFLINLQDG